jgi:hypothetical protein
LKATEYQSGKMKQCSLSICALNSCIVNSKASR